MHILFALQTAFSLWMLTDAVRRGAPHAWWLVVLVPFGEWAYFFAVFLPNQRYGEELKRRLFTKRVTIEELRRNLRQTPSHHNRVQLAQGLHDKGEYAEAAELFAKVINASPKDKEALYGYARCAAESGETAISIDALEQIVELDITYADFDACLELADAYWDDGRRGDALALLEKLHRRSERIAPCAALARRLIDSERADEAREILITGLDSYDGSPAFVRKRDRRHARVARTLLAKTGAR